MNYDFALTMTQQINYTNNKLVIERESLLVDTDEVTFEIVKGVSYFLVAINIFVGILAVLGNGLVLYAAYGNRNNGRLNYLDSVIKSLAVNDLIYGLIGTPFRTIYRLNDIWYYHNGK